MSGRSLRDRLMRRKKREGERQLFVPNSHWFGAPSLLFVWIQNNNVSEMHSERGTKKPHCLQVVVSLGWKMMLRLFLQCSKSDMTQCNQVNCYVQCCEVCYRIQSTCFASLCSQEQTRCGMWPKKHSASWSKSGGRMFCFSKPIAQVNP